MGASVSTIAWCVLGGMFVFMFALMLFVAWGNTPDHTHWEGSADEYDEYKKQSIAEARDWYNKRHPWSK